VDDVLGSLRADPRTRPIPVVQLRDRTQPIVIA
jgi:hypothetical protein